MTKISAVIIAYNEENKIEECLESVSWADEIILINSSSTDKTIEKAKKYTSKIINQPNHLMLNTNKNFGFSKAGNEWILNLDADERVSSKLALEIQQTIKVSSGCDGYWIPRKNMIFGKWIRHAGWYPDYQLRLFKKGKGKFDEKHVHEMIKVDGKTEYLKEHIVHLNYQTIIQFLNKHVNIYAVNEAEVLIANGYQFNWLDSIRFPFREFLSRFFARKGYKDGLHGLILSMLMAFYHLIIFSIIWEKQGFKDVETKNILEETEKEFKRGHKETTFWFLNEKIKQANFANKIILSLRRKLS